MKGQTLTVVGLTAVLGLTGCMENDPNRRAKIGAMTGAVAGAVIGHQIDDGSAGYAVGALVGGLAGAGVGNYMDNQQRDFENTMAAEQDAHQMEIERLKDDTLKLTLDSEVSFDFGKSDIKYAFHHSLDKLANVINKYDRSIVHVVGHTDNVGSDLYNQRLSEDRAVSVANYLISRGVVSSRVQTEGRGEREPRATNATEAGRQLNRRVEIYIKPIVEGQENRAYESPRYY
jgi:outer membrane protein OmpA-like peptidoglycan-associated protein